VTDWERERSRILATKNPLKTDQSHGSSITADEERRLIIMLLEHMYQKWGRSQHAPKVLAILRIAIDDIARGRHYEYMDDEEPSP